MKILVDDNLLDFLSKKLNEDTISDYEYFDKRINIGIDGGGEDGHYILLSKTYLPQQKNISKLDI